MACNRHKKRENGKVVPVFEGLAANVKSTLDALYNIESITRGSVRKYRGKPKVKISPWWQHRRRVKVEVCDATFGECEIWVATPHTGPIARHLGRRLAAQSIAVV